MSQPVSLLTAAEQHRRNTLRRLLLAIGALALVVASTVIVTLFIVEDEHPQSAPAASQEQQQHTDTSGLLQPGTGIWTMPPVSAGPLVLPQPTGLEKAVPVGFPHTTEGAISAAARYAQAAVGLDVDRARTLGDVVGAPAYLDASHDFTRGARSARDTLGLAPGEPVAGAYLTFTPQAYRVTDATPDRVRLAILGRVDAAGPATHGQGRTSTVATSYTLVWADGDWRIAGDGDALPAGVPMPRTPTAYQQGWRDLALA
jgi:hypothetical protein